MTEKIDGVAEAALMFNLADEEGRREHKMAIDGRNFYFALLDIVAHFRKKEKNEYALPLSWSDIREEINEIIYDNGINLDFYE